MSLPSFLCCPDVSAFMNSLDPLWAQLGSRVGARLQKQQPQQQRQQYDVALWRSGLLISVLRHKKNKQLIASESGHHWRRAGAHTTCCVEAVFIPVDLVGGICEVPVCAAGTALSPGIGPWSANVLVWVGDSFRPAWGDWPMIA